MLKCDFNKAALQSHFGMGFLLKFATHFLNTFSYEHKNFTKFTGKHLCWSLEHTSTRS